MRAQGKFSMVTLENMEDMNISYLFGGCISAFLMSVAGQDSCYKWICAGRPAWQSCGVNRGCQKLAQNCSRQIPSKIMMMIIKVARVTFVIKLAMLTRIGRVASPILEDKRAILGERDSMDCWDS